MIKFPNNINKAVVTVDKSFNYSNKVKVNYILYGEDESIIIPKILNKNLGEYTNDIVDVVEETKKDCLGFSIVKYSNGDYGYRGKLGNLCIHKYDFVTPFDNSGFAFGGKAGKVFLINKNMNYLSSNNMFTNFGVKNIFKDVRLYQVNGFRQVEKYSNGKIPLCRASFSRQDDENIMWSYFNKVGKIIEFKQYDLNGIQPYSYQVFGTCSQFVGDVALVNDGLLFSNGKYYKKELILESLRNYESLPLDIRNYINQYLNNKSHVMKRI